LPKIIKGVDGVLLFEAQRAYSRSGVLGEEAASHFLPARRFESAVSSPSGVPGQSPSC